MSNTILGIHLTARKEIELVLKYLVMARLSVHIYLNTIQDRAAPEDVYEDGWDGAGPLLDDIEAAEWGAKNLLKQLEKRRHHA
jgi:hypothetical protein